jgi:peptide deformylase
MSKMLNIYTINDPKEEKILRTKSEKVPQEEIEKKNFQEFLDDLLYTAQHSEEQGNVAAGGIAAPQVGRNIRVFWILNYETDDWEVFINPEVTPNTFLKSTGPEGCLSVPFREDMVTRYNSVKIKFLDREGNKQTRKYRDLNAISIQHEYDHLEGILFIDKISK